MDKIEHGGPAFPSRLSWGRMKDDASVEAIHDGMSIRDWFAGQALSGYTANPATEASETASLARWSYEAADAMLAARTFKTEA